MRASVRNTRLMKARLEADVRLWSQDGRTVVLRVTVDPSAPDVRAALAALDATLIAAAARAVQGFQA